MDYADTQIIEFWYFIVCGIQHLLVCRYFFFFRYSFIIQIDLDVIYVSFSLIGKPMNCELCFHIFCFLHLLWFPMYFDHFLNTSFTQYFWTQSCLDVFKILCICFDFTFHVMWLLLEFSYCILQKILARGVCKDIHEKSGNVHSPSFLVCHDGWSLNMVHALRCEIFLEF